MNAKMKKDENKNEKKKWKQMWNNDENKCEVTIKANHNDE